MNYGFVDFFAVLICSAISSMGLGGGGVLLLYLSLFTQIPQLSAQGLNLLLFVPVCITSLIIYIKQKMIILSAVLPVLAGSLSGVFIGRMLLNRIPPDYFRICFAVFLICVGSFNIVTQAAKTKIHK